MVPPPYRTIYCAIEYQPLYPSQPRGCFDFSSINTRSLLDVHITNILLYHSNLPFSSRMPELELLIIDCFIKQLIVYNIVGSILFVLFIFIAKICPRHFRRWAGYYAHTRKKKWLCSKRGSETADRLHFTLFLVKCNTSMCSLDLTLR